jgi:hypothetical protein
MSNSKAPFFISSNVVPIKHPRDSIKKETNLMAIQIKSSANNFASNVESFESNLQENERVIAFNLNPSASQQASGDGLKAAGEKKQKTFWTSTASSFMFGEYGAFADSKLLVAAHLWDGAKYIPAPLYGKDDKKVYKVLPGAEPTGLAGEMYGYYLATIDSSMEELAVAMDSIEDSDELDVAMAKFNELQAEKDDISVFFGLCNGVQKKIDIPNLSQQEMVSNWAAMSRKQSRVLKLKVVVSYETEGKFDINVKVISYVVEDGHLVTAQRGQTINQQESEVLREGGLNHFRQINASAKGVVAKATTTLEALQSTAKEGNSNTKRKNEYRAQKKAREAEIAKAIETQEQSAALGITPVVEDLNSLDLAELENI